MTLTLPGESGSPELRKNVPPMSRPMIARGEAQPHGARSGRVHPRRRPASPTVVEPSHHCHSIGERDVLWQRHGSPACATDERNGADEGGVLAIECECHWRLREPAIEGVAKTRQAKRPFESRCAGRRRMPECARPRREAEHVEKQPVVVRLVFQQLQVDHEA